MVEFIFFRSGIAAKFYSISMINIVPRFAGFLFFPDQSNNLHHFCTLKFYTLFLPGPDML
jgi:hypothetical protein